MSQHDDERYEYPDEAFHAGSWAPAPRRNQRRIRIVGAIVITSLLLLGGGAAWISLFFNTRLAEPLPPEISSARSASAVQLVTGHCLAELPGHGDVSTVRLVPCGEEHGAEVYSQFAFAEEAVWPGQADAHARIARSCQLSEELVDAGVTVVTWAPSPSSWQRGDRTGLCLAVLPAPAAGPLLPTES